MDDETQSVLLANAAEAMRESADLFRRLAEHDENAELTSGERVECEELLDRVWFCPPGTPGGILADYLTDLLNDREPEDPPRVPPKCTLHAFAAEDIHRDGSTAMQRPIVHAIVTPEDDWFIAQALEVDIASQGKTRDEALDNLHEALALAAEGA